MRECAGEERRTRTFEPLGFMMLTVSKLKVYDKNNCTMVFMININSYMYGEMILGVFEIF